MINLTEICCVARITIEIMQSFQSVIGAPDTIRTCDLCLRRATLYPAELRVPVGRTNDRPCNNARSTSLIGQT